MSNVFHIDMLEDEFRAAFDPLKPWIFEADGPNGEWIQETYATEDEACARQIEWRQNHEA